MSLVAGFRMKSLVVWMFFPAEVRLSLYNCTQFLSATKNCGKINVFSRRMDGQLPWYEDDDQVLSQNHLRIFKPKTKKLYYTILHSNKERVPWPSCIHPPMTKLRKLNRKLSWSNWEPSYVPLNPGCFIGILMMIYFNPYITGQYNPLTLNNHFPHDSGSATLGQLFRAHGKRSPVIQMVCPGCDATTSCDGLKEWLNGSSKSEPGCFFLNMNGRVFRWYSFKLLGSFEKK